MSGWNKNHFHFHFLALIHPHLQILVSSFTRCGFLFAANSHFNAPAFLALDSIVVICVNFFLLSNSSASQVVTHMIRQFWQRKNLIGQRKKKTWTRTGDVSPANCSDLAFLVSSLTELLQHEELLQQVWQKFQLRKELCLSDLGFAYTDSLISIRI